MTEKTHEVPAHLQQPHDHHHAQSPMQQVGGGQPHAQLYNGHHGQGVGGVGGVGSFGAGGPGAMNEGAMYQQHLMTQCARGNHSYDTKVSEPNGQGKDWARRC